MSSHAPANAGNPNPGNGNPPVTPPDPTTGKDAAGGVNAQIGLAVAADAQTIGGSVRFTSKHPAFDIASLARFRKDEGEPDKVFTEQKKRFEEPESHNIDKTPQAPRFTQVEAKNVTIAPRFFQRG